MFAWAAPSAEARHAGPPSAERERRRVATASASDVGARLARLDVTCDAAETD